MGRSDQDSSTDSDNSSWALCLLVKANGAAGCVPPDCDDGHACTIDYCQAQACVHTIGPNEGSTACPPAQHCTLDAGCVCDPGLSLCGDGCVDTASSEEHCGDCGQACQPGFVCQLGKCSCLGCCLWSMRVGDEEDWQSGNGVATDAAGNVALTGTFEGSVDFGGGMLASAGGGDVFVAKLGPSGNHLWSKRFGDAASSQAGLGVVVDGASNVVLTGTFEGSIDFGGGSLTSAGGGDVFVAKLGSNGDHIWSKRFGDGWDWQSGHGVATDGAEDVFVTGTFRGAADFGCGTLASAGWGDIFVAKLGR